MKTLSIIFGTYNRIELLKNCVESIRRAVADIPYEIVVTDGGSTDGSIEWLDAQIDVDLHIESERRGAVVAFNDAYARSHGEYILALNDDVEIIDSLAPIFKLFEEDALTGQLALAYMEKPRRGPQASRAHAFNTHVMHRHTYANIGVIRRDLADEIVKIQGGFWNPIYHTYAADTELSCWVWRLGCYVRSTHEVRCVDHVCEDSLRADNNSGRNQEDAQTCHLRWPDWRYLKPHNLEPRVSPNELAALREWEQAHPREAI